MKRLPVMLALVALMLIRSTGASAQEGKRKFVPVTDAMLQNPDPANWMMWRRTLDSWGYSPLSQVNRNNVSQLRLVWTRGWLWHASSGPRFNPGAGGFFTLTPADLSLSEEVDAHD